MIEMVDEIDDFLCRICFNFWIFEKWKRIIVWDIIRREIITEIILLLISNPVFIKKKLRYEYIKIKYH